MYTTKINSEFLIYMTPQVLSLEKNTIPLARTMLDIVLWRLGCIFPQCFFQQAYVWNIPWKIDGILNVHWNEPKKKELLSAQELINIIKTAWFKEEPMRTLDGKIILKELLINFWNIPAEHRKTIFSELKKHPDGTFLLFWLSLEAAKEQILRWEAVSINAFVEDFDHPDFHKAMMKFFNWENINPMNIQQCIDPSLLTIELLEDHEQKELSLGIIKQIKRVESLGIHLAIDDYSFGSEKSAHTKNQSRLIMLRLMKEEIPFRIKVDGGIISAVFPIEWHRNMEGNSMKDHFWDDYTERQNNMKQVIIQQIQVFLEAWIIVVLEWVIPAQLPILREIFWSTRNASTHLLVQGMELWDRDFEEER